MGGLSPRDFKSLVSTYFTTRAIEMDCYKMGWQSLAALYLEAGFFCMLVTGIHLKNSARNSRSCERWGSNWPGKSFLAL